jgi:hypothetical protein
MFHDLRLSSVRVPIGAETLSGDLGVPSTPRGLVIFAGAGMRAEGRLEIVPGATHLFEEPGALEHVTRLAGDWFEQYLHPTTAASGATSLAR